MAVAVQIAPYENDMVVQMRGFAQRMIRAVAATGSGAATSEVLAFQQAFNLNLPVIKSLLAKLGKTSTTYVKLVEDARYGPKTASALYVFLPVAPPTKAAEMPVWYARNQDIVDGLQPPTAPPVMSVLNESPPIPGDDAGAAQAVLNSGGSVIRDVVPVVTASSARSPSSPQIISTTTSVVPTGVSPLQAELHDAPGPNTPVVQLRQEELAAVGIDVGAATALPELDIVGTVPRSRVPVLALALGAAGLGGVMYWWTTRKRRRR